MNSDRADDVGSDARHAIWRHADNAAWRTADGGADPEWVHRQVLRQHPDVTLDQVQRVTRERRYCH